MSRGEDTTHSLGSVLGSCFVYNCCSSKYCRKESETKICVKQQCILSILNRVYVCAVHVTSKRRTRGALQTRLKHRAVCEDKHCKRNRVMCETSEAGLAVDVRNSIASVTNVITVMYNTAAIAPDCAATQCSGVVPLSTG